MIEAQYTYETKNKHLSEKEALDLYTKEKARHPGAIITLEDLDCGHWIVNVYQTDREKDILIRRKLTHLIDNLWSVFRK